MVGVVLFRLLGNCLSKFDVGEQMTFLCCFRKASMLHIFRSMDVYILAVGVEESPLPRLFV